MPFTQKAPSDAGCSGLGDTRVTRPSSTVTRDPQWALHSQQVLGMMVLVVLFMVLLPVVDGSLTNFFAPFPSRRGLG